MVHGVGRDFQTIEVRFSSNFLSFRERKCYLSGMAVKKKQEIEVEISGVAFGGKGIAKIDGFTVFVEPAVPLDIVRARVVKKRKSYAEARTIELISPSPHRTDPPCEYSGYCGGCKWQFLDYNRQLEYKRGHVAEAIEHIGLIRDADSMVLPTIPSEKIFGYRNKMEFTCSDKRWLLPEEIAQDVEIERDFAIGLHVPGTFDKIIDTKQCFLQPDLGNGILEDVRSYMKSSNVPVYGLRSHEGFWRFLMLRHSVARDQWMANIVTSREEPNTVGPLAELLMKKYPKIVSIVNNVTSRKAGVAVGEYEIRLAGEPVLRDRIGAHEFEISANSFFQTNTKGAERLYETVENYAELTGGETVLDLYCGTGSIAISLSEKAKTVIGMEIVESSIRDAERNCRINNVSNCRFVSGDIKDKLPQISEKIDVLIIDPPRAGMHKKVLEQVMNIAPERIVYVSCNPSTMARDIVTLKEKYGISEIRPVDMFPHTWHIESVAKLRKQS